MRFRHRLGSVVLILCALTVLFLYTRMRQERIDAGNKALLTEDTIEAFSDVFTDTQTLHLWYTDPALTEYLTLQAVAWQERNADVRVRLELVSGIEYLERIQQESVNNKRSAPDLYLITHDTLEKAYLAGLSSPIEDGDTLLRSGFYPKAALDAVSYHGRLIAYPFYYETATLLYNRTYLAAHAYDRIEDELIASGLVEEIEDIEISEEEVDALLDEILPRSIADIMEFADAYNAPEEVEAVFEWDVNDIFTNYFFAGAYLRVGGDTGDDIAQIDIYNEDAIKSLLFFQQLNQFFAIDASQVDSASIVEDFLAGRTVFTVATTDMVRRIEEEAAKGTFSCAYDVITNPSLNEELDGRTMSVTNCIVINGYSDNAKGANAFAHFLTSDDSENLYLMSGKCAARYGVTYRNPVLTTFFDAYANSVPISKMIETSNFWMHLEIAFTDIWNGADVNDTLRALSERVMTQVSGTAYEEDRIADPVTDSTE